MNVFNRVGFRVSAVLTLLLFSSCSQNEEQSKGESTQEQHIQEQVTEAITNDNSELQKIDDVVTMPPGLPQLQACQNLTPPTLPEKWTASALMQTFGEYDVVVGKFTYDESEQAYRFSLSFAGSSEFSDYLLTADNRLYALQGSYEQPSSCRYSLMLQMDLPSSNIMTPAAQCVGEGPVNGVNRQWWKDTANVGKGANWYWFTADNDRELFRMMPYKGVDNLGWAGKYAFTYFSEFSAQVETNIGALKQLCGVSEFADIMAEDEVLDMATALQQLLPPLDPIPTETEVSSFMPEVQQCTSSTQRPPQWPASLQATTLLTAVNIDYSPFPSLVRYNSSVPGLRTDMYNPWPPTDETWDLYSARLLQNTGYSAYFKDDVYQSCKQNLPGPPLANWMTIDGCECKASLPPGSSLNPTDENLLVMMCPLTPSSANPENPQVFWTWYGEQSGAPQVFMQSDSSAGQGTGLNLADYYSWEPNALIDPQIFTPPTACLDKIKDKVPPQCHNCHLPINSEHKSDGNMQWHIPLE